MTADFTRMVMEFERPLQRVSDLAETARRLTAAADGPEESKLEPMILKTRKQLLAHALIARCELTAFADLFAIWTNMTEGDRPQLEADFSMERAACESLIEDAGRSKYPVQQVEGHVLWAHFAAIECGSLSHQGEEASKGAETLKGIANVHIELAQELCNVNPAQTQSVAEEVDGVRRMLRDPSYDGEMQMIVTGMEKDFGGTGDWYACVNGHPFAIGESGMSVQQATCPSCGAGIGGQRHQAAAGAPHVEELEREFGKLWL